MVLKLGLMMGKGWEDEAMLIDEPMCNARKVNMNMKEKWESEKEASVFNGSMGGRRDPWFGGFKL